MARRVRRGIAAVLVFLALLFALVVGLSATVVSAVSEWLGSAVVRVPGVFDAVENAHRPGSSGALTFLLVGADELMLAQLSPDRSTATIVSLPGESWAPVPGHGTGTLAGAYSRGGPALLVGTVENLTHVRIDHLAMIDVAGLRSAVDEPGVEGGPRPADVLRALVTRLASPPASPLARYRLLDAVSRSVMVDDTAGNDDLRALALDLGDLAPGQPVFRTAPIEGEGRDGPHAVLYLDGARAADLWAALRTGDTAGYGDREPAARPGAAPP